MANDHDIHTCGCNKCEVEYALRYYSSQDEYKEEKEKNKNNILKDFTILELKKEIKRRKNK